MAPSRCPVAGTSFSGLSILATWPRQVADHRVMFQSGLTATQATSAEAAHRASTLPMPATSHPGQQPHLLDVPSAAIDRPAAAFYQECLHDSRCRFSNTLAVDTELPGQGVDVLEHLLGEQGCAGRDLSDQRHLDRLRAPGAELGGPGGPHSVGAGTVWVAEEDSLVFECSQLMGDRGGGGEVHGLADFPHGGRVALPGDRLADVADDGRLAGCQLAFDGFVCLGGGPCVLACCSPSPAPPCKILAERDLNPPSGAYGTPGVEVASWPRGTSALPTGTGRPRESGPWASPLPRHYRTSQLVDKLAARS